MIEKMLTILRPTLEAEGNWEEIASLVHEILQSGNGAMRQRAIYLQNGRMEDAYDTVESVLVHPHQMYESVLWSATRPGEDTRIFFLTAYVALRDLTQSM